MTGDVDDAINRFIALSSVDMAVHRRTHSVNFRALWVGIEGSASGQGIYVLPLIVLIVVAVKYLL